MRLREKCNIISNAVKEFNQSSGCNVATKTYSNKYIDELIKRFISGA